MPGGRRASHKTPRPSAVLGHTDHAELGGFLARHRAGGDRYPGPYLMCCSIICDGSIRSVIRAEDDHVIRLARR